MSSNENTHNFVPDNFSPHIIGIIGGKGVMGRKLAEMYVSQGYKVIVTGEERDAGISGKVLYLLNRKLVHKCDVIIIAIPINYLEKGWQPIFGSNKTSGLRSKLIIDIASTKVKPLIALSNVKGASIIGSHPMFGPLSEIRDQNVVLCPIPRNNAVLDARLELCLLWLKESWIKAGAQVEIMTPEEHDRLAAIQQIGVFLPVLEHALLVSREPKRITLQKLSTPNSRVIFERAKNMLRTDKNDLNVYAQILVSNDYSSKVIDDMLEILIRIKKALSSEGNIQLITDILLEISNDFNNGGSQGQGRSVF